MFMFVCECYVYSNGKYILKFLGVDVLSYSNQYCASALVVSEVARLYLQTMRKINYSLNTYDLHN